MFVTGRLALAVAVGIVPLVLAGLAEFPPYAALGIWVLLCVLLVVLDVLLAPVSYTHLTLPTIYSV